MKKNENADLEVNVVDCSKLSSCCKRSSGENL